MGSATAAPLSTWRFSGTLRTYQSEVLERLEPGSGVETAVRSFRCHPIRRQRRYDRFTRTAAPT
jgi:hypothetical protein